MGGAVRRLPAHVEQPHALPAGDLRRLGREVRASPSFTTNTLNRDFVGTRGFSVVFRGSERSLVEQRFPWCAAYLERALQPGCNAFYLNPLLLERGSRVDPHVDRSLRSYCKEILPPRHVSVLYVEVAEDLVGGALVLARGKKHLARIRPRAGSLVIFQGDLLHSIERVESGGPRLSIVCEQYALEPGELERIPAFALETRART